MKKGLLAVSFGTARPDGLALAIAPTEQALAAACPGWELRRAFSSGRIRQRLETDSVAQALDRLAAEGVTHVAVQPLYITQGSEYEKLCAQLEPYRGRMRIAVGAPLLHREADCIAVADALPEWLPPLDAGEALILMGHGSTDSDNAPYVRLARILQARCDRIYVAVMKGAPTLDSVKALLAQRPEIRKLMLAPLLLVSGGHAHTDMSGGDGSWEKQLNAAGYPVRCVFQGLGQCPAIQELFASHCRRAVETLEQSV